MTSEAQLSVRAAGLWCLPGPSPPAWHPALGTQSHCFSFLKTFHLVDWQCVQTAHSNARKRPGWGRDIVGVEARVGSTHGEAFR